jgi:hypothetical protein
LKSLLADAAISQEQFNVELEAMNDALAPAGLDNQLNSLQTLEKELEVLQLRARVGDTVADKMQLENDLRAEGVEINRAIENRINAVINGLRILTEATKRQADADREPARARDAEQRQLDRLERRIKSQQALNDEAGLLQTLFDQNRLSVDEFNLALQDTQLKGLEASNALEDGFTRAFIKIKREADDLAAVGENVVNVFADNATDALVKFAETGQFKFKEFANAILHPPGSHSHHCTFAGCADHQRIYGRWWNSPGRRCSWYLRTPSGRWYRSSQSQFHCR